MPGLLDTFKQKATAVKDYLYPPAPNGMSLWEYAQQRANDPLQPNLSSRITQQDLINKGLNLAGLAPVGMVGRAKTQYEIAHDIASKNAEKMLGLPKGNTYIDRAKALGFDTRFQHGSPDDFRVIDPAMLQRSDAGYLGKGFYGTQEGARAYADVAAYPLVANTSKMRKIDNTNWNIDSPYTAVANRFGTSGNPEHKRKVAEEFTKEMQAKGYTGILDKSGGDGSEIGQIVAYNPEVVRSRFAAFDPARIHESDLLAGLAPYLGVGGLLGLGMYGNQDRMTD
jgi:hypothetical protein